MPSTIRNLEAIKSYSPKDYPLLGVHIYEALQDMIANQNAMTQQTNANVAGQPSPPPAVDGVAVSAQNGHFQVAIQDSNEFYRGLTYHVEHADNPNFTNSQTEYLGPSRNANLYLGNVTRYFKVYSSYDSSAVSTPVYHGSATAPIAVTGGGGDPGPSFLASQGSGTGTPGQTASGYGPVAFRSTTGKPPVRA